MPTQQQYYYEAWLGYMYSGNMDPMTPELLAESVPGLLYGMPGPLELP